MCVGTVGAAAVVELPQTYGDDLRRARAARRRWMSLLQLVHS